MSTRALGVAAVAAAAILLVATGGLERAPAATVAVLVLGVAAIAAALLGGNGE